MLSVPFDVNVVEEIPIHSVSSKKALDPIAPKLEVTNILQIKNGLVQ